MTAATHRRIVVTRRGPPEVLQATEEPLPVPGPGQVRVRTLAAGVSAFDVMLRSISFPGFPRPPFTPGVDVVGVVDAHGDGVTGPEIGQTVAALLDQSAGSYAEYVCLPAERAVAVPDGLDPSLAVCVVANYMTAYIMMHTAAHVQPGESFLVHGAAGGTGTAFLDLGRMTGLEMYGTASSHNHDVVRSFGATPIDYRSEDFVARIRELTGDGVDVVFDQVGGSRQVRRSYRALRKGGRLVWFGVAATKKRGKWVIPGSLVMRTAVSLLPDGKEAPMPPAAAPKDAATYARTLTQLLDWLADGSLEPLVHERVPLLEAAHAHEILEQGRYAGKVVLVSEPNAG